MLYLWNCHPQSECFSIMQNIIYFLFDLTLLYPFLQDWWSFISYHELLWPWFLSKVKEALSANSCQCQWNQAGVCYSLLAGLAGNCSVLHTNDGFVNWHLIRQRWLGPSRWGGETNLEKCQTQSFWDATLPVVHGKAGWLSDFGGSALVGAVVSWFGAWSVTSIQCPEIYLWVPLQSVCFLNYFYYHYFFCHDPEDQS